VGNLSGGARNVRITGKPTIPESLDLTELPDLTSWLTDYYGESNTGDNADWKKQGEEIVGRKQEDRFAGSRRQSLLKYHRPLLEDGEIEYEFYYEPGKTLVHPALDRLTFLLEPAGVRVHWLTDAQFDRTGLGPENATDEPANRRGPKALPLKERDWNRLKVSLKGDVASLALNGTAIYERKLEPTNRRGFGLFHYMDQTDVRVRKFSYRGNWPKSLPAVADQELAAAPETQK